MMDARGYVTAAMVVGGTVAFLAWREILQKKKREAEETQNIATTVVSEWTVTADPPLVPPKGRGELRETLSEVDEWLCNPSHWLTFALRFDSVLDPERVRAGLARTLAHIPAVGARVDPASNPIQYELVLTAERQGVVLEVARGDISSDGLTLPDDTVPREVWQKSGLDGPPAGYKGAPGPDDPLLRARLTVFEQRGVSYLSIGISHGLCDGHGVTDILRVWSHFCTPSSTLKNLPPSLRRPRTFGRRVTDPVRPAKDRAELERRRPDDVGDGMDPFSESDFYLKVIPRAIWCLSMHRVLELRIHADRLAALKTSVSKALPEGEWASRFEVLFASLILAQRATAEKMLPSDHNLHVSCNLRGRAKRFDKDYFGNAAFDFCRSLHLNGKPSWTLPDLVKVVRQVHLAVRDGLDHPEDVCRTKDWFEAARHLGVRNTNDVWEPVVLDALRGRGTFINSWESAWMEVSMGANEDAVAMIAYFGVWQHLFVEVPRHRPSGDSTVHIALAAKHAVRLVEMCKPSTKNASFPVPFSLVS